MRFIIQTLFLGLFYVCNLNILVSSLFLELFYAAISRTTKISVPLHHLEPILGVLKLN